MNMKLSDAGLAQTAHNEGFSAKLYFDHKGYSIGHGHLCSPAEVAKYQGKEITMDEANALLLQDTAKAEIYVNDTIKVPLTQAQFDAVVDFTYNEGVGAFANISQNLNKSDFRGAALRMMLYTKVRKNGQLVDDAGLAARRKQEVKAFGMSL